MTKPRPKRPLPTIYPWHARVMVQVIKRGYATVEEIGDAVYSRYAPTRADLRSQLALHELLELRAMGLVDRVEMHGHDLWVPDLLADEFLRLFRAQRHHQGGRT